MNRIIKFRGKRLDNGQWAYGSLLQGESQSVIATIKDNSINVHDCFEVDPDSVGQFTGLCDKNGKEIYEGDIVHYQDSMGYLFVSPIEFREGKFCMKTKYSNCITFSNKGRYNDGKCSFEYNIEHEVLGNIHDNPELLNEK